MPRFALPASVRTATTMLPVLGFTLALACDGGDGADLASEGNKQAGSAAACTGVDTTPVILAVREFIAKATPTPQYFLSAAGTDSAVPEDGFKVLQDKGPTYFFSGDSAARQSVRDKLASNGPYAALLVVYRGKTESEGGSVDVRLRGHYVGGEQDGKGLPQKTFTVRCDAGSWALASTTDEATP